MTYYVYVLKSQIDGSLYKGMSSNPDSRLKSHNRGKVRSTKAYRPWKIVHRKSYASKDEALQREKFLKSGAGRKLLDALNL